MFPWRNKQHMIIRSMKMNTAMGMVTVTKNPKNKEGTAKVMDTDMVTKRKQKKNQYKCKTSLTSMRRNTMMNIMMSTSTKKKKKKKRETATDMGTSTVTDMDMDMTTKVNLPSTRKKKWAHCTFGEDINYMAHLQKVSKSRSLALLF